MHQHVDEPIQVTALGRRLRDLRASAGLSQNGLAHAARVDPAYVHRLEHATEVGSLGPSRGVVVRLWLAVSDDEDDLDLLLADAGLLPESVVRAGGWEPFIAAWRGNVRVLEHKLELSRVYGQQLARDAVRRLRELPNGARQ
jgi:transcriptional regulator with XRE-family HTH domain